MIGVTYKSKAAMKAAIGQNLKYVETSMFGPEFNPNGKTLFVGPDAYHNRKYFGTVTCQGGKIVKVI